MLSIEEIKEMNLSFIDSLIGLNGALDVMESNNKAYSLILEEMSDVSVNFSTEIMRHLEHEAIKSSGLSCWKKCLCGVSHD